MKYFLPPPKRGDPNPTEGHYGLLMMLMNTFCQRYRKQMCTVYLLPDGVTRKDLGTKKGSPRISKKNNSISKITCTEETTLKLNLF